MRKLSNNSLWAVLLLSFVYLFGSSAAQAQIPVTNAEGTKHNLKYYLNQVKEGKFTLDTTTQVTKVTTAIGDQTKGLSEFVKKSKEKIEKAKEQFDKYKKQVEEYKAEYDKYKEQVRQLKADVEKTVADAKNTVNQVKDGINTAKDIVNSAGDIVSSAGEMAKGQLGELASAAGVDSSALSGVLGGNSGGSSADTDTNHVTNSSDSTYSGSTSTPAISSSSGSSGGSTTSSAGYSSSGSNVSPVSSSSVSGVAGGSAGMAGSNSSSVGVGSNAGSSAYGSNSAVADSYTAPVSSRKAFVSTTSPSAVSSPVEASTAVDTLSVMASAAEPVVTAESAAMMSNAAVSDSLAVAVDNQYGTPVAASPQISSTDMNSTTEMQKNNMPVSTATAVRSSVAQPVTVTPLSDLQIQNKQAQTQVKDKNFIGTSLNTTDIQTAKTPQTRQIKPVRRSFKPQNSDLRSEVSPLQSFAQARYSETLAFAMLKLSDNGTDINGTFIVPPTVNMPCGLSSSTALENGNMDKCLIKFNDAAKRPQAEEVESTQAYYAQGKKELIAAYIAEAYKAQRETEDFTEKVLSPIELAVAPTELDIYSNIVEANKAVVTAINGILKIKSSRLALDIYNNYGTYRFSSPEEDE